MGERQNREIEPFEKSKKETGGMMEIGQTAREIKELKRQIQQLQADKEELEIYKGYCLYQMGSYRTICNKENGLHPLSFSEWRKQIEEAKRQDSTQEG